MFIGNGGLFYISFSISDLALSVIKIKYRYDLDFIALLDRTKYLLRTYYGASEPGRLYRKFLLNINCLTLIATSPDPEEELKTGGLILPDYKI